jgi:hypothetical protein
MHTGPKFWFGSERPKMETESRTELSWQYFFLVYLFVSSDDVRASTIVLSQLAIRDKILYLCLVGGV